VSQQQWGGQPRYGAQPPSGQPTYGPAQPRPGYPAPPPGYPPYGAPGGYGQPQFGRGSVPGFGAPLLGVPPQPMPGPRKSSPLKVLMLALIAVCVLAVGGLVLVGLLAGPSEVAYQNDDYKVPPPDKNPPPLPVPKTYEEAQQWVTKNRFYDQTAPLPVRCNSRPINVGTASDEELKSHFEGLMECLLRVWQPPLTKAGYIIVRPTVTIYGDSITTKCGNKSHKETVNAFYASCDQQIYYSNKLDDETPIMRENKWAADVVMAHEFGHALQARSGILWAYGTLADQATDKGAVLELSRRTETQADCFSGMFIRAVSRSLGVQQSDLQGIEQVPIAFGDDTFSGKPDIVGNHGRSVNRKYWTDIGLGTSPIDKCNTFVALKSLVR
jgi:predicted metalloprotease